MTSNSEQDLSDGSPTAIDELSIGEILADGKQSREFRKLAFGGIGLVALAFFLALLIIIVRIWLCPHPIPMGADKLAQGRLLFYGLTLILLASVPLSLSLAIVKLSTHKSGLDRNDGLSVTTPLIEFLKALADFFKSSPKS